MNSQFWSFQSDSDIWRAISSYLCKIFTWNSQYYHILFLVETWQSFIKFWDGSCPSLKHLHHLVRNHFDLLWNLEDSVLIQTLSYRRKITYYLFILIGFFYKLISNQCRYWCSNRSKISYKARLRIVPIFGVGLSV